MDNSLTVGLLLILGFVTLVTAMVILVCLARRRGRWVVMAGAFLSVFDPAIVTYSQMQMKGGFFRPF